MSRQRLNQFNHPCVSDEQGVGDWQKQDSDQEIEAVNDTDIIVQPGFCVEIFALENDIGDNLSITSVSLRNTDYGTVETNGETITYCSEANFGGLDCFEETQVTIDYSIADNLGNTDDGVILVTVHRQGWAWADEDGDFISNQDETLVALCDDELPFAWSNQDGTAVVDEDEAWVVFDE